MFFLVWMGHLFAFSSCPMRGAYAIRPYTYRPKGASQPAAIPYMYMNTTYIPPPLVMRGRCPLSPTFFSCLATRKEGKRKSSPREGFLWPNGRRIWKKGKRFYDEAGGYRLYFQRRWVQSQPAGSRRMVRSMRRVYSSVIQFSGLERGASVRS